MRSYTPLLFLLAVTACDSSPETDAGPAADAGPPATTPLECEGVAPVGDPDAPAQFDVQGERAVMTGVIGSTTPALVTALLADAPQVRVIVMPDVPGSEDDESNLQAARQIRAAGLATCVPSTGSIASGGVDFFLAGTRRSAADGARLGVHSWGGPGFDGVDLPRDDPEHRRYLDYYAEMGIDAEFYWFTLMAAPADDIHWMTRAEIERYGMEAAP